MSNIEDFAALLLKANILPRQNPPKTGALWECPHCQDRIRSMHRHDYVTCKCGKTSVDGGGEYDRMCWEDKPPIKVGP